MLTEKADEDDVRIFLESTEDVETQGDRDNVDAILQASMSANKEVYDNVREVIKMSDVVREFFQPAFDKAVEEEVEERLEERVKEEAEKVAAEMVEEKLEERLEESTVGFTKAIMESYNIGVDEAMDKLKIAENERDILRQKIAAAM